MDEEKKPEFTLEELMRAVGLEPQPEPTPEELEAWRRKAKEWEAKHDLQTGREGMSER